MTAPVVAEEAAAASRVAPTSSAPVGTARTSAGSSGAKPRTQNQLRPKAGGSSGGGSSSSSSSSSTGSTRTGGGGRRRGNTVATTGGGGGSSHKGRHSRGPALLAPFNRSSSSGKWSGRSRARQLLVAEFVGCSIILALSPLTDKHKQDTPGDWMKRATAICGVFLVLGIVATGGQKAAKVSATFGGLILTALLLSDRDVLTKIADRMGAPTTAGNSGPPDSGGSLFGPGDGSGGNNGGVDNGVPPSVGEPSLPTFNLPAPGVPSTVTPGNSPWDWFWRFASGLGPL